MGKHMSENTTKERQRVLRLNLLYNISPMTPQNKSCHWALPYCMCAISTENISDNTLKETQQFLVTSLS